MSKQGRHHYIPIFYLKQWAGDDECICEFSNPYDRVKPKRVHPAGTGYYDGLNTVEGLPDNQKQYLEDEFFKVVDDEAARVLRLLVAPPPWRLDAKQRSGWSRFIMSLMMRHPEAVQKHREVAKGIFDESLGRIKELYANERKDTDPPTYEEYAELHGPNPAGRTIVRVIQTLIDNVDMGRAINSMRWTVMHEPRARFQLLTSDRPLLVTNGIGPPRGQILMPISPFHLFVATNNAETENEIREALKTRDGVPQVNNRVAIQSRKYVYGSDDSQLTFVAKRLGSKYTADPLENLSVADQIAAARTVPQVTSPVVVE